MLYTYICICYLEYETFIYVQNLQGTWPYSCFCLNSSNGKYFAFKKISSMKNYEVFEYIALALLQVKEQKQL